MDIYKPAEDSYLLSETLKNYLKDKDKKIKILDMGSGSGIQAETCRGLGFENILTADINHHAVKSLTKKGFEAVQTDLFSNINEKFNLIIFNPPYLPEDKKEPEDSRIITTAGKKGYEIIFKFLEEAKIHLNKNGEILLLFSSFSKPKIILKKTKELGYKSKLISKKRIFFEELFVYQFYQKI